MNINNRFDRMDRVDGINQHYKDHTVNIVVDNAGLQRIPLQAMLLISANLLSRWCKKVNVHTENSECLLQNFLGRSLHEVLIEQAAKSPACDFTVNSGESVKFDSTLFIGNVFETGTLNTVWIDSSGWLAGWGNSQPTARVEYRNGDANILGASWAACLAVAEIFRFSVGLPEDITDPMWYSLFDFQSSASPESLSNPGSFSENLDLGIAHQVGCGAVGSSFIYLLSLLNWKVDLHIIDYDEVQDHNCPTSLIFSEENGILGDKKAEICKKFISPGPLNVVPHIGDYKEFIDSGKYKESMPDLILCFANERNIWLNIVHELPPLNYHATTTRNWGINFGRHIPLKEWCLVCRFFLRSII